MMTPGCTVAVRFTASISMMLVHLQQADDDARRRVGVLPPLRLVPAPRVKMGRRCRAAACTTCETSAVERGKTTATGRPGTESAAASNP